MAVMIGIDPHKASHTAVALDESEQVLGELRVRSAASQVERLVEWAAPLGERTWAIEGAGGLGYLLAQQLVAAGERVVDVQPKLAARVRLLATGDTNKNDPNDARSVAVAALRSPGLRVVQAEDHAAVMKVWAKRHRHSARHRTRVACRLHAVLCELIPGGIAGEITAAQASRLLDDIEPAGAVAAARHELAAELVADLRRLDAQQRDARRRITAAVTASRTTLTTLFGVGPIVAATVIGDVGDVSRFPSRDTFAAYNGTAPTEVSSGPRKIHRLSGRGNRRLNHALHMAAVTQIRHRHSEGRAYYDRKIGQGHSGKEAIRVLKRRISDGHLRPNAPRRAPRSAGSHGGPGRAHRERLCRQRGRLTPRTPALRSSHSRTRHHPTTDRHASSPLEADGTLVRRPKRLLTNKADSFGRALGYGDRPACSRTRAPRTCTYGHVVGLLRRCSARDHAVVTLCDTLEMVRRKLWKPLLVEVEKRLHEGKEAIGATSADDRHHREGR